MILWRHAGNHFALLPDAAWEEILHEARVYQVSVDKALIFMVFPAACRAVEIHTFIITWRAFLGIVFQREPARTLLSTI